VFLEGWPSRASYLALPPEQPSDGGTEELLGERLPLSSDVGKQEIYAARDAPTSGDNGHRSPRKLLRVVVARLLGRKPA